MIKVVLRNGTQLIFGDTNHLDGFNVVKSKGFDENGIAVAEDVLAIVYIDKIGNVEIGSHRYIEFKDIQGFIYSDVETKPSEKEVVKE